MNRRLLQLIKIWIMFSLGFCTYSIIEMVYRGYTYFSMGVLGGLSLLLIDGINNYISWNIPLLVQGCMGGMIVTLFELIVGVTERIIKPLPSQQYMWDYSSIPLNWNGVICLPFSIVWVGISIIGIIVADIVNYYVLNEEVKGTDIVANRPYYKILGFTLLLPKREGR